MSQHASESIFPPADRSFCQRIVPFLSGTFLLPADRSFCRRNVPFLSGTFLLPSDRSFSWRNDPFGGGTDLRAYARDNHATPARSSRGFRSECGRGRPATTRATGARGRDRLRPGPMNQDRGNATPANTSANVESSGRHPFEDCKTRGTLSSNPTVGLS